MLRPKCCTVVRIISRALRAAIWLTVWFGEKRFTLRQLVIVNNTFLFKCSYLCQFRIKVFLSLTVSNVLAYLIFIASIVVFSWNCLLNYFFVIGYLPTDVLPPASEDFDEASGIKKLIEYKFNEDGKKVKVLVPYFSFILLLFHAFWTFQLWQLLLSFLDTCLWTWVINRC